MQKVDHSKILAIDPGTSLMGIAFLDGGNLVYHGVEVIRSRKSPHEKLREAQQAVLRLIDDFKPSLLAVEKAFFSRSRNAALLNVLVDEIKALARKRGLAVVSYAPSTLKKFTCGNGLASKKEVARAMVARYPELKVFLTQDRSWKERYHHNMFDAVALASMAAQYGTTRNLN